MIFFISYYLTNIDQNAYISMKIYQDNDNPNNAERRVITSLNITLSKANRNLDQKQIERNLEKWGSQNWVYFSQILDFKDIQFSDQYFVINTKNNIGMIEVDEHEHPVESTLYFSVYYNIFQDSMKLIKNDSVDFYFIFKNYTSFKLCNYIYQISIKIELTDKILICWLLLCKIIEVYIHQDFLYLYLLQYHS